MKNHETTLKNHGNQPKTMKSHENRLKNYGNQPKTMTNHETTLKNHGNRQKFNIPFGYYLLTISLTIGKQMIILVKEIVTI